MNKTKEVTIKKISSEETYAVRQPILREGRPIEDCKFSQDDDDSTFHLGLFLKNELIGVVTFIKNEKKEFSGIQYQLRGMAVLKEYQKKGYGNLMFKKGQEIIKARKGNVIWCNAREIAVSFYKRNGFKIIGKPFVVPQIGLHSVMYKTL